MTDLRQTGGVDRLADIERWLYVCPICGASDGGRFHCCPTPDAPDRVAAERVKFVPASQLEGAVDACDELARAATRGSDGSVVIPNDAWLRWCDAVVTTGVGW